MFVEGRRARQEKWRKEERKDIEYFIEFLKNLQKFRIHEFMLTLKHMYISCKNAQRGNKMATAQAKEKLPPNLHFH